MIYCKKSEMTSTIITPNIFLMTICTIGIWMTDVSIQVTMPGEKKTIVPG